MDPIYSEILHQMCAFLHGILCAGIVYTSFCRLRHTSDDTARYLRVSLWVTAVVPLYLLIFSAEHATWEMNAILATFLTSRLVSAKLWGFGVPAGYSKCDIDLPITPEDVKASVPASSVSTFVSNATAIAKNQSEHKIAA